MRGLGTLIAILIGLSAFSATSAEAKRVAFVVGINTYDNLKPDQQLSKAVNDARAIADVLKDDQFQVILAENATRSVFLRSWQRFLDSVEPGDVTTVYFAGHGIELNGVNFLLTRDVPRPDDGEEVMRGSALRIGALMDRLRDQNPQVSVWIVDACRDSPYAGPGVTRGVGSTRGLKREEPPKGTLVMMSAGTGQGALDSLSPADSNPNSIYTRTLLPLLKEPGLEITDLAKRVRSQVEALASTIRREQRPAFYHELSGDFFLVPPQAAAPAAGSASPGLSEAAQAWNSAKDTTSPAVLDDFINRFNGTFYAGLARARLEDLRKKPQGPNAPMVTAVIPPALSPSAAASSPPQLAPLPSNKSPSAMESAQAWLGVRDSNDVAAFEKFLGRYGDSIYADMARGRLDAARREQPRVNSDLGSAAKPSGPAPFAMTRAEPQIEPPVAPARPSLDQPPSASESAQAWLAVKDANDPDLFKAFLQRHGGSIYADRARAKLAELNDATKRSQVAALPAQKPAISGAATPAIGIYPPPQPTALTSAQERSLKQKDTFQECPKCPEMVVVPAGKFLMGSAETEPGRASTEGPQRLVSIAKAFAVGRFAVTFDEWEACVAGGGCNGYNPTAEGGRRGRNPVVNVSWDDAKAYVAWLSKTTGKPYRLLSESEREYAARGGTTTPFWFGTTISTTQANYNGSIAYGSGEKGEYRKRTLPVNFFEPNPFGLYQVHGNVYEWTEDCWRPSYANAPNDGSPRTLADCSGRTLRGGSLSDAPTELRSAARSGFASDERVNRVGFRVARSL
jgi:formylglycine-generating enzyme required for sulfatase activity